MKEILLVGGGGHCRACIDVIEKEGKYKIAGIIDDALHDNNNKEILGYPVLGKDEDLEKLKNKYDYALVTIGQIKTPSSRIELYNKLKKLDYTLPTIISPLAYIAKDVTISEGTIIMHHTLLNTSSKIGKMCIVNTKALIEHDCIVQDFCHISTGAILNGGCEIGEQTFVGSNMGIKHNTKIDSQQIIYTNQFIKGGGVNKLTFLPQGGKCA